LADANRDCLLLQEAAVTNYSEGAKRTSQAPPVDGNRDGTETGTLSDGTETGVRCVKEAEPDKSDRAK
jgi:hypothetical protein